MFVVENGDMQALKTICYSAGSIESKKDFSYLQLCQFRAQRDGQKVLCEVVKENGKPVAGYFLTIGKSHFRLFEIATVQDKRRIGLGSKMLNRIFDHMKIRGYSKLTFRTREDSEAFHFWIAKGGGDCRLFSKSKGIRNANQNKRAGFMKYYSSPRWSNEIADCSMPMTFDTYSNCSFNCLYCFSQFQRALGECGKSYLARVANPVSVARVKKIFSDPDCSQFGEYIKQRKVMQWGGLSDQFDGNERKNGVTLELLKFFKEINYPICFSTKSVWWTKDERYMSLFRGQKNWNVKFSIITMDEKKAQKMEGGVPSPEERLKAIERIANAGCGGATLRLRPFIIGVSTPSYLELIERAAGCGASALSTEFLCVEQRSREFKKKLPIFNELCGFDLLKFYKKYSVSAGYLRLNRKVKAPFVLNMKKKCDSLGMRFYVSDAHFKECCSNGSCCGLPEDWNYSRGQWCEALQIAKKNGFVCFSDVKNDINTLLRFEHGKAIGFNCNTSENRSHFYGMSMAEYMRWLWNNPQSGQSPYKLFEGILVPEGKDNEGNLIYKYNIRKTIGE